MTVLSHIARASERFLNHLSVAVYREPSDKAHAKSDSRCLVLNESMSNLEIVFAQLHEITHRVLNHDSIEPAKTLEHHWPKSDERETEANCIATFVLEHFEIHLTPHLQLMALSVSPEHLFYGSKKVCEALGRELGEPSPIQADCLEKMAANSGTQLRCWKNGEFTLPGAQVTSDNVPEWSLSYDEIGVMERQGWITRTFSTHSIERDTRGLTPLGRCIGDLLP